MKKATSTVLQKHWEERFAGHFDTLPELLIPALEYVQKEEGYLPREAIAALAEHFRLPESKVFGVASFYSMFRFKPRGRRQITVCRGTACHVRGSARLLGDLEKRLGVKAGGTTPDSLISLETVSCLGSCALAPVVVQEKVYGRQTTASVRKLVDEIRSSILKPHRTPVLAKSSRKKRPTQKKAALAKR